MWVTRYERSPEARKLCLEKYRYKCIICDFDFESVYGARGHEFIEVHHLIELSERGGEYEVTADDLRPVCPNCHAMIHHKSPMLTIEEAKNIIAEAENSARSQHANQQR